MKKQSFNCGWSYSDIYEGQDAFAPAPEMLSVVLPHDAMIARKRRAGIPGGAAAGQYEHQNTLYEKRFVLEESDAAETVLLEFEGIFANSSVFVNGNYLGGAHYGYSNFILDASDAVIRNGENLVQVYTKTGMGMLTRWYTGDGIYRDTWLYTGGTKYIIPDSLQIVTDRIDDRTAVLTIRGTLHGHTGTEELDLTVTGPAGEECGQITHISFAEEGNFTVHFEIPEAALWSDETPALYTMILAVKENGKLIDSIDERFGIRTIEVKPGTGILINGKSVKLRGGCIHHDNGVLGAVDNDDVSCRRISILKEAGYNAIRSAHNPISKSLLKACDEIGMYVMDESFDVWIKPKTEYDFSMYFEDSWEIELKRMIRKDYNHPSVIMYAIGNEIQNLDTAYGIRTNKKLAAYVKALDPSRPVTNAVNGMFTAMAHMGEILQEIAGDEIAGDGPLEINQVMTMLDSHMDEIMRHRYISDMLLPISEELDLTGYNYMGGRYDEDCRRYPERVIVGSETRPDSIGKNWELVKKLPNVIGDFVWTAWDYIGESGIGRVDFENPDSPMYADYPYYLAYTGDIDICGNRRPASYYREIVWGLREKPYIAVCRPQNIGKRAHTSNWSWSDSIHSWTFPGFEGKDTDVEVYSCAEEVELFLNGRSIGSKKVGTEKYGMAIFHLQYERGELRAVNKKGSAAGEEDVLRTLEGEKHLQVDLSTDKVLANGGKLIFADISIEDAEGNVDMSEAYQVRIKTEGPLTLLGFGSADPRSMEDFFDPERTSYDGRLLAVFRADQGTGEATIWFENDKMDKVVKKVSVN